MEVKYLGGDSVIVIDAKTVNQTTIVIKDKLIDRSVAGALDALDAMGDKPLAVRTPRKVVGTTGRIEVGYSGTTAKASDLRESLIRTEGVTAEFLSHTPRALYLAEQAKEAEKVSKSKAKAPAVAS